jgi:Bacterial extracellular solute-binding proteins, family 3
MPVVLSGLLLLGVAGAGAPHVSGAVAAQNHNRRLRVATGPVAPFVLKQDNGLSGFSIDLWEALARRLDREFSWRGGWYGAVLSLPSPLLAFTVNTAIGKQNPRQQLVIAQGKALHDFYTYARMLNEPAKSKLQKLIREYTRLRIDLSQLLNPPSFENALRRSDETETQMNELVAPVVKEDTPLVLINTLEGIDDSGDGVLPRPLIAYPRVSCCC